MISNITKKLESAERQIIANMNEVEKAEYEIRKAGFDLDSMKAIGFKYDPEIIAGPVLQAEQFCLDVICASYNY